MAFLRSAFLALVTVLVALLAPTVIHLAKIGGPFLTPKPTHVGEGQAPIVIQDTVHCEDVHHYRPANLLFTACEDDKTVRFDWFPGLGHLKLHSSQGSIHVVDPKTMKSTRLVFEGFKGDFVTHGIDVIEDPKQADAVYIFAINHLPNPDFVAADGIAEDIHAARSQIELFHHVLESNTVQHVRSILHPLVQTPNDIVAVALDTFYVTNDHYYRGGIMRLIEDAWPFAKWTNIINVKITDLKTKDAMAGLDAVVSHEGLWNNNGLGHGRREDELVISSAIGGELYLGQVHAANRSIDVHTTLPFDTVTDNPSYYADPYRSESDDASGFVVAGISQGIYLGQTAHDINGKEPLQVWYTRQTSTGTWENKLLFEDDGTRIRSASAAVLVPIEPVGGRKKAWLFVTGFLSESMVAVQVDL
ncbi:hypothetical protein N7532_001312 [Penicillium argentinense]|uniref:Serum paraoxonase/arylesterase family protein n=1 Tax=Penicillium argentinense TaxID=1131581 RepID=A0A9W9KMD4_9EURO|nr:uncharacterized protein N7532_001312 [Penicillium argentinense]KAJ5110777.1 hypothetical protein N7532_001312 [Penicillium argentinense]